MFKTKITPIVRRRDVKAVVESPAKRIGALETDRVGDGFDREVLSGQTPPRFIQPAVPHKEAGSLPEAT